MNAKVLAVLKYVDIVLSAVYSFLSCSIVLMGIGVIAFFQQNEFLENGLQQNLFLNINTLVLTILFVIEVADLIYMRREKIKWYYIFRWSSLLCCFVTLKWYGKSTDLPYSSLDVLGLLYFVAVFFVLKNLLSRIVEYNTSRVVVQDKERG